MLYTKTVGESQVLTWFTFVVLTVVHVIANWYAVRGLVFSTLNRSRFAACADTWRRTGNVPTPREVGEQESVFTRLVCCGVGSGTPLNMVVLGGGLRDCSGAGLRALSKSRSTDSGTEAGGS